MSIEPERHGKTIIFPASLDPDAVSVVKRLVDSGFESYLVGGCVRDLLCGMIPKDFDVSTAARPRQIRSRFRNCRVIGRRFKLAHVHFGDKIIEVATFRRTPDEQGEDEEAEDLLIVRDNEYGSAEEDALRRDFTINALLYDVNTDEVIDYIGGVQDLDDRVLRTIGDPHIRLAEDPVRMLRAVKFSARLGLTLDDDLEQAMRDSADLIAKSSPPRVLEEIYKLLSCGRAARSLPMLAEYGLLAHLLPEFAPWWLEHPERLVALGAALDVVDHGTRRLPNAFLLSALALEPWRAGLEGDGIDPLGAAGDLLAPAARRMSIPRRDVAIAKQLLTLQPRLEKNKRNRRVKMADFLSRPLTHQAVDLLYVSSLAGGADPDMHALWARRLAERNDGAAPPDAAASVSSSEEGAPKRRRRRRRGGRGRSRSEAGDAPRPGERQASPDGEAKPSRPRQGSRRRDSDAEEQAPADGDAALGAAAASAPSPEPSVAPSRAPSQAPPTTPSAAGRDAIEPEAPRGLRGLLRRVVKRLRPESEPTTSPDDADLARAPRPSPASPAEAEASSESSNQASPTADAPTSPTQDTASDPTGDPPRPRRRRRSRGRRGRGKSATHQGDGDGGQAAEPSGDAPSGARKPRRRRGGSRRSRSRSGSRSQEVTETGGAESLPPLGDDKGSPKSSGQDKPASQRGKRPKTSRSRGRGKQDSDRDARDSKVGSSPKEPPPVHQRPEDIEDYFDW